MKSKSKQSIEKLYVFGGSKFVEYVDMEKFREQIEAELKIPEEVISSLPLNEIFFKIHTEYPASMNQLNKVFFDNIFYSHLKHIYVNKFDAKVNLTQFKVRVKKLLEKLNFNESITSSLHPLMSEDGFYLMDRLNITSIKTKFIAGLDYKYEGKKVVGARMIFVEVVPTNNSSQYFIGAVDIDFENQTVLIMIKNKQNIAKLENEVENAELDRTVYRLYNRINHYLSSTLLIKASPIDLKKDRGGMYDLCKNLDEELLKDIRADVVSQTSSSLSKSVKKLLKELFPSGVKPKKNDINKLEENISSMLIATYIKTNFDSSDLVKMAKKKKLVGYPTKIKFTSNKSNKGSTESSGSKYPVSASDMFHSLYISFKDALGLEQWSISWFTDYKFSDVKDEDVVQTTVYSKSTYFEIVFKASRALDKEIIYHVVGYLNKYRK